MNEDELKKGGGVLTIDQIEGVQIYTTRDDTQQLGGRGVVVRVIIRTIYS